jgi:diapolycopene oxygenase
MERMGVTDLRRHIVCEDMWTPYDIEQRYYSNGGSIYGVVADRWKNFALKAPKRSERYENLFFVGGSVNPGGGMPMVVLCGQNAAALISRTIQPQG